MSVRLSDDAWYNPPTYDDEELALQAECEEWEDAQNQELKLKENKNGKQEERN